MIWDKAYTEHDIDITEKLTTIYQKLKEYLNEEGIVTFEWNGHFVSKPVKDWTFDQPNSEFVQKRKDWIEKWLKEGNLYKIEKPKNWSVESILESLRQYEKQGHYTDMEVIEEKEREEEENMAQTTERFKEIVKGFKKHSDISETKKIN